MIQKWVLNKNVKYYFDFIDLLERNHTDPVTRTDEWIGGLPSFNLQQIFAFRNLFTK